MKAMTLGVLLMHMTSAGGAGAEEKRAGKHVQDAGGDEKGGVTKEVSSLKGEITSLKEEFRVAREKQRLAAEEKKRLEEARYGVPAKTPPVTASGGTGATAR
ncbi:hypothetical protein OV208_16440 [Corallococcus sp. bb12-1]|uniref:hypothetical protein n=1 Tax=Corallococcus sp. bb12-1 TaxID=2996784 RepID=UPI00226F89DF|nr:hypothetical protein [Corallococcus sp. bb12-1]MCY1042910.1 hypothetical protein [Corallococcus sp. bb12-1]